MPQEPAQNPDPREPLTYRRVDELTLRNLLKHRGYPGVEYAIITHENLFSAQQEGWERLAGREQKLFRIEGPKGTVVCDLWGRGKPIPGQTMGPRSPLWIDKKVWERTGLKADGNGEGKPEAQSPSPSEPPPPAKSGSPPKAQSSAPKPGSQGPLA